MSRFGPAVPWGGRDAGENLVIHYGADGQPAGCEIEHASQHPEHVATAMKMLCQAVRRQLDKEQRCSQS